MKPTEFIEKYLPAARQAAGNTGIFPEIITSAALIESGGGESQLAKKYNNFFGVKAGKSWKGKTIDFKTKEYTGTDRETTIVAKFRAYASPVDSFADYVKLLTTAKRYQDVPTAKTIEAQAKEIHEAGYSTAANYADRLAAVANSVKKYIPLIKKGIPAGVAVAAIAAGVLLIRSSYGRK